ncbi:MAG: RNA polymerase sigma factor [Pseudonocardiaceae bacterium]
MTTTTRNCPSADAPGDLADLLLRVSDGDPVAWDEILLRYGKLVSATVRSFRMQDADALDAVQMTWLRLAENAHQVRCPERLAGWLTTTARRECLSILRRATVAANLHQPAPETVADPSLGPEQRVIDADTTQTLWNIVAQLPPRRGALLRELFTDHPRPYGEVARAAGIPIGGVGPSRARALRQLRDRLYDGGLGPDAWR